MVRSFLYVPGDRPDRLASALAGEADAVIADLEDGVAPAAKEGAREAVAGWLDGLDATPATRPQVWVRVAGEALEADVAVAARAGVRGVLLPKAVPALLARLDALLLAAEDARGLAPGALRVAPLLETAAGVLDARVLALAPRVSHLGLGEADLGAELGVAGEAFAGPLLAVRAQVVLASAAAALAPPTGPVSTVLRDDDALRASTRELRAMGFGSRSCIHPAQVGVVNAVFSPTEAELERARAVVTAFEAAGGGVCVLDGRMLDEAVVRSARRILAP